MNLLFVIPEYPPHTGGGIITFYKNLLPELVRQGHRVHALVGSAFTAKLPSYEADGVTVEFLDHEKVEANLNLFGRYRAVPELQRHLAAAWTAYEQADQGKGFDVVETTDWGMLFVPWVVERDGPPVVVQLHGSVGQIDYYDRKVGEEVHGILCRSIESLVLPEADELQSCSKANCDEWQVRIGREVNYIEPAWNSTVQAHDGRGPTSKGLVVGRIQHWKGAGVLCEALRMLGDAAPEIDWVGRDTPFGDAATSMSEHLANSYPDVWGKKISVHGQMSPPEVANMQKSAAFVLVPSLWDVFNFTCVESMGYGKVVLCSNGAGAAGIMTDSLDGFTFNASDPQALADCLAKLNCLTDNKRSEMGASARETIRTKLSIESVASRRADRFAKLSDAGRKKGSLNNWLHDAVTPHKQNNIGMAFLDRLPLKELTLHVGRRTLRKVTRTNS